MIVVEENCVKIWDLEEDFLVTRHQVSIHKPVLGSVLLEEKKEIVLLLEEGLVVTLNHKLEFTHKMSLGEPGITKVVKWSEDTLVFFAQDSRFYLYDWTKKRAVQDIFLREKVDMYCIENFGDLENRILDGEYKVADAHISGRMKVNLERYPMAALLTERNEILIYDFQKGRILNYLVSHYGTVTMCNPGREGDE